MQVAAAFIGDKFLNADRDFLTDATLAVRVRLTLTCGPHWIEHPRHTLGHAQIVCPLYLGLCLDRSLSLGAAGDC